MNISPISSTSFKARIIGQTDAKGNSFTKSQMIKTYDDQIAKINAQKLRAIELDTFMKSDEITSLAQQLPDDTTIEVASNYSGVMDETSQGNITPEHALLLYCDENEDIVDTFDAQNDDGSVNNEGIINWLEGLNK